MATEPHTVPRLRVWACPIHGNAAASSGWLVAEAGLPLKRALAHGGANADRAVGEFDAVKSGQPHDVEHNARPRHAHAQHRHQRLSAGEDGGIGALRRKDFKRLVENFCPHVVERCRLHDFTARALSSRA